jgi:hypothetical protein
MTELTQYERDCMVHKVFNNNNKNNNTAVPEIKPMALHMLGKNSTTEPYFQP